MGSVMLLRHQRITDLATEIVGHRQKYAREAQSELRAIERRRVEVEAEIRAAKLARERLVRFQPEIDGSPHCPRCWVEDEVQSQLTKIRGTDRYELFGCHRCGRDIAAPNEGMGVPDPTTFDRFYDAIRKEIISAGE
jgi:hypothetical protein